MLHVEPRWTVQVQVGAEDSFVDGKPTVRMDSRVKSDGKIQAVAENGTPLGGESMFHYTFFLAYGEDGNTLLSKLPFCICIRRHVAAILTCRILY